jgi:replicative DNA helicase
MADGTPRALPHDLQAEMGVLGSMLLSPEAVYLARERLDIESFYKLSHQDVFKAILDLAEARNTVDLILLRDELKKRDRLEQVGGVAYLTELMEAVPTSANVEYYIEIVRDHAIRRHLIETSSRIMNASYEDGQLVDDLLDEAESKVLAVRHMKDARRVQDMPALLHQIMARLDHAHQHPGRLTGLPTGFYDIDELMSGLQTGELIVVAARPSVGKTSLALNILHHVCMVERRPAVLYSLEVHAQQIVSNLLCIHNKLDTQDFRRGTLNDTQWQDLEDSLDKLASLPLYIDDSPSLKIGELRARARRERHQHAVELIVVDYLQLVSPNRFRDSRATEVSEISAGLKALARELEVPVIAISQLSRAVEREQRRPRMSDLRESGAIEQDADVVMLLHRPEETEEEDDFGAADARKAPHSAAGTYADVIIAKQRNGPVGTCPLVFLKRYLRFESRATPGGQ